ncbi:MAG TPA: patatin-like phospholipase family protein [Alphaproteobacteria bacterium]|nr:patatin-like phospholipase family protein [Alphaproteobacteria bacterium]
MNEVASIRRLPFFRPRATRPVRILSIDGGGIRGLIPAMVLADIERRTGRPISELFDLIAGTSSGGLIALALASPGIGGKSRCAAYDLVRLYETEGSRVFSRTMWHAIRAVGNLVEGKYPTTGIEGVLEQYFGELKLSDALVDVMIAAYEIERRRPYFFKSWHARERDAQDFLSRDVLRAATAAPTFFEPARIHALDGRGDYALIDGAVYLFNPALSAFAEARVLYPEADEFLMVSLGTGQMTRRFEYLDVKDWGAARWAQPVFDIGCDGQQEVVDYQLRQLLPPDPKGRTRYYRFQTRLELGNDDMDDASQSNMRILKHLGEDLVLRNQGSLRALCQLLEDWSTAETEKSATRQAAASRFPE